MALVTWRGTLRAGVRGSLRLPGRAHPVPPAALHAYASVDLTGEVRR
ncbi:hypothetical protein OG792_15595 [Micromonospora sp. NBC_01699]|nr:hypothetical protein [Micromonospora sp. NBC_01699]